MLSSSVQWSYCDSAPARRLQGDRRRNSKLWPITNVMDDMYRNWHHILPETDVLLKTPTVIACILIRLGEGLHGNHHGQTPLHAELTWEARPLSTPSTQQSSVSASYPTIINDKLFSSCIVISILLSLSSVCLYAIFRNVWLCNGLGRK